MATAAPAITRPAPPDRTAGPPLGRRRCRMGEPAVRAVAAGLVLGVRLGLGDSGYVAMLLPGWGLPWGETWPSRLPVPAAVVPAGLGAPARSVHGVLFVWTTLHARMHPVGGHGR